MQELLNQSAQRKPDSSLEDVFIILCATGFENVARARSALMFASLAASANYRTILYCIQDAVDLMVKGALEERREPEQGGPTVVRRLREALAAGVEIQCCTQTMANKRIVEEDLFPGVKPAGAMNLIALTSTAKGTLCF
jgi:predicted peroxiredoxin